LTIGTIVSVDGAVQSASWLSAIFSWFFIILEELWV
jgi:hypothetical protein